MAFLGLGTVRGASPSPPSPGCAQEGAAEHRGKVCPHAAPPPVQKTAFPQWPVCGPRALRSLLVGTAAGRRKGQGLTWSSWKQTLLLATGQQSQKGLETVCPAFWGLGGFLQKTELSQVQGRQQEAPRPSLLT